MSPFWSISLFWISTVAIVVVALLFIVPPLLRGGSKREKHSRRDINIAVYRDEMKELEEDRASGSLAADQYDTARKELEARLVEDALAREDDAVTGSKPDRRLVWGLAAMVPLAAFSLYFWLGNPGAFMGGAATPAASTEVAGGEAGGPAHPGAGAFVKQLEQKVRSNPGDGNALADLGFAYAMTGRFPEAYKAYVAANKLLPEEPRILSAFAEVTAIVNNNNLEGKPMEMVNKALSINPNEVRGLLLSGEYAVQHKEYEKAAQFWERAARNLPPEDQTRQTILDKAQEARRIAKGGTPMDQLDNLSAQGQAGNQQTAVKAPVAAAGGGSISGRVEIAPALKARLGPNDVLFVIARAPAGGPPLAAVKGAAASLPADFNLDDSMAMAPGANLSSQKAVTIVARVTRSGQPTPNPGDMEGTVMGVKIGSQDVKIVIDKVR